MIRPSCVAISLARCVLAGEIDRTADRERKRESCVHHDAGPSARAAGALAGWLAVLEEWQDPGVGDGWGWAGTSREFLRTTRDELLESLASHHERAIGMRPSGFQVDVWTREYDAMTDALKGKPADWGVVFEYELPLEGGRRPDVVVLAGGTVIVIEFKSVLRYYQAHLDQVEDYARDLSEYHEASHGRSVQPILVMRDVPAIAGRRGGTPITDPDGIGPLLEQYASEGPIDLEAWLNSAYVPLPTLIAAARRIFRHETLPHIRRARSIGIPETVELVGQVAADAEQASDRVLVFVTGVPGSGKTLVGLRAVYERSGEELATFLSGNGPLVQVLQDALRSRVFVRDLHAFIKTYGLQEKVPAQNIIVFDEAQRAWDARYMERQRGVAASEPELLLRAGERVADWCVLVGLVGEGQEIHSGEESGIPQWAKAAAKGPWQVVCPPKLAAEFENARVEERLDLTVSLRSRTADELHEWVRRALSGSVSMAARLAQRIHLSGYHLYVTRDLEAAKAYARVKNEDDPEKRYGLLASSHAKNLEVYGIRNGYLDQRKLKVAKWFNAPPDDDLSCCTFNMPVTEFQCQGLEIDLPIVCWGSDFRWDGTAWARRPIKRRYPQDNPNQLLENAYRVLLTRGRDGLIVWVPPGDEADPTEHLLLAAGLRPLPTADELQAGEPILGSSGVSSA